MNHNQKNFVMGLLVGLVTCAIAAAMLSDLKPVNAQEKQNVVYRVSGTSSDSKCEEEINKLAKHGCKPILAAGSGYSETHIILECPDGAPSLHK